MSNKNDVREIHGEDFVDGLDEQFDFEGDGQDHTESEEVVTQPSLRYRVVNQLFEIVSSRMAFWLGGFVDGLIIGLIIAYVRSH